MAGFLLLLGVAFSWAGAPVISAEEQVASQPVFDPLTLALCCLLGLLAVGVESSVGNWIPTLAFRESSAHNSISLTSSLFWVGIVTGRLFASKTTRSIAPRTLGVLNSLLALASVLLIIRVHGLALLSAGGFLTAFWISSIYPLAIARAVPLKGRRWLFIVAGLGSSFMPWLTGVYSQRWGSLRLALALPAAGCLLLAGLFVMSRAKPRVSVGGD
jgi:fucose permease